ncbi:TetR family transcriptional regulator [Arthrobacter sp. MYb214]|uniref:TetR/AcrR family transcriptional regulator n=1 Tax=Arthrobacter sp. MYb214 TaxID=1848596 RepID=UPI000CFDF1B4|nr:TetR/AcrR family transcriptional regulator [Arthrobacter sp. MYb214]PRB78049.1 TetR family transcriptional regulator [Arthrobacter sp. MYb214]
MTGNQPRTGPRPRHSRDKIAQAAIALADEEGMGAVSIRAVAAKIGAGAASLYRYVESHEELTGLMVEQISAEYELESLAGSAAQQLLGLAAQGLQIMRRHPWVPSLAMGKSSMGPNALAYLERGLAALEGSGLEAGAKLHCLAMLNAITAAFALNEQSQQRPEDPAALFAQLETGRYPHLSAALGQAARPVDQQEAFENAIMHYLRGAGVIPN